MAPPVPAIIGGFVILAVIVGGITRYVLKRISEGPDN
jgi:hypothetical protein